MSTIAARKVQLDDGREVLVTSVATVLPRRTRATNLTDDTDYDRLNLIESYAQRMARYRKEAKEEGEIDVSLD